MTIRLIIAAAALVLLPTACAPASATTRTAPPTPSAPSVPTVANGSDGSGDSDGSASLEGRYRYETMDAYVDEVVGAFLTPWLRDTWRAMPAPASVVYVPHGASGPEACGTGDGRRASYTARSYEYCGADQTVYIGQDMLWTFYTRAGDAGPAIGLAHEYGHHIQDESGVPNPRTAAESIRHENQADCIAGAWTRYVDQQGRLEYPDDIEDIDALFSLIGSAEGPGRDHGTTPERVAAFERGFDGDVAACDAFYPATPISTG